uniref:Major facilitator superfamily (MFS) profile domain-containing protein n=1 Tax=Panagrolaimus superbus TaxID=310955 RepID=A0A914YLY9_9BILA
MIKEPIGGEQDFIHQLNITNPEPLYTLGERSWLFSAIAIGNIIGTIPLTWSNNRFGVRKTFGVYGFISGISTLLLPLFVETNFILAFFARTLQGFGLAISLTSLGAIVSSWSSLEGAGTFISFLSMHVQFGNQLINKSIIKFDE